MAVCEHENPPGASFCATCGMALGAACASCGAALPAAAAFCPSCGLAVGEGPGVGATATRTPTTPALDSSGERRKLTVMFCDLAGSTALANRLDPEQHKEIVEGYYELVSEAMATWGGHIGQYMGDGVLAFFGYPVSREDNTARAVLAGLQIQESIAAVNAVGGINGELIAARVGIHVGLVVLEEMGVDSGRGVHAMGDAVNFAARIQDAANNGEVFVSAAAARLAGPGFDLQDRGEHDLKGIPEPQHLFCVTGVQDRPERLEPTDELSFVGRTAERGVLTSRWELARSGKGAAVVLRGDAGIGKSRLVRQALVDLDPPG
ncbi:MAG: adenylate/guanylate cyclase domain-containing protein [Actinomycetota bacterium]